MQLFNALKRWNSAILGLRPRRAICPSWMRPHSRRKSGWIESTAKEPLIVRKTAGAGHLLSFVTQASMTNNFLQASVMWLVFWATTRESVERY